MNTLTCSGADHESLRLDERGTEGSSSVEIPTSLLNVLRLLSPSSPRARTDLPLAAHPGLCERARAFLALLRLQRHA